MAGFSSYLFVLLTILSSVRHSKSTGNICTNTVGIKCPCTYDTQGRLEINCRGKTLTSVPAGIQKDASVVNFSNNTITAIQIGDFGGLKDMATLFLQENRISTIAEGAFNGLYSLTTINLQNNKLTAIESGHFLYLPSLTSLDISYNKIARFAKDSILYLPKLGLLAINANPLNCDCEMKAFRDSISARGGDLLLETAQCEGTNILMTSAPESQFGTCREEGSLFHTITCMNCKNVKSTEECIRQNNTISCSVKLHSRPTCFEELTYVTSQLFINKGCQNYVPCLDSERNNADNCYGKTTEARCNFCCVGDNCNRRQLRGRLHTSTYIVSVQVNADLPASLADHRSSTYTNFAVAVQSQVDNALNNKPSSAGSFVTTLISLTGPQMTAHLIIVLTTIVEVESNDRIDYIEKQIRGLLHLYASTYPLDTIAVVLAAGARCPAMTTSNDKGQFHWSATNAGMKIVIDCPVQTEARETASRTCKESFEAPVWDAPDTSACPSKTVTQSLADLADTSVNNNNAGTVQAELSELSKQSTEFNAQDVDNSVDVIENLLVEGSVYTDEARSENMVETMSNLLNSPDSSITQSEVSSKSSERFINSVEKFANQITPASDDFTAVKDNLALLVRKADPNNFSGITMLANVKPGQQLNNNQIVVKEGVDNSSLTSGVIVPASFFETAGKNSPRFSFAVYGSDKMFKSVDTKSLSSIPSTTENHIKNLNTVNGPVISTSVQNTNVNGLQEPVLFRFNHFTDNADRPQCVYVKTTSSGKLQWSDQGCIIKKYVRGSHTDCECDHLTSFALLMDIYQTGEGLSEGNRLALTYISYIGCGISLLGLLLTLITYFMFRKLRVNNPSKILINLCIALALTNMVFLVGMQEYTLDNDIGCKIVAVALHYVLLSAICWMLVEAFYMYLALIKVFNTYISHFVLKCCLFGWGVPLIVVAVTLGINSTDNYGQQAGGICWLSPIPFYAAFLAPVGLILILNFITFVLVFKTLMKGSSKKLTKSDNKNSVSQRLRGAVALIILLGLTWAFAIFAIGDGGIAFQYLFTIFNSLQGLFIFIFYCLLKSDAQQAWKKKLGYVPPQYSGPTTSKGTRTFSSEVSESKKEFTDISKEIDAVYPEAKVRPKKNGQRYPSYTESDT